MKKAILYATEDAVEIDEDFANWLDENSGSIILKIIKDNNTVRKITFKGKLDVLKQSEFPKLIPVKNKPNSNFLIGDKVSWETKSKKKMSGIVLKVYETTFGASVRDTALQVKLSRKINGRSKTTIRASNCVKV